MIGADDDLEGGEDNKRGGSRKRGKTTIEGLVIAKKLGHCEK